MPICPQCQRTSPTLAAPCPDDDRFFVADRALDDAPDDPLLGTMIAQKYIVVDLIDEGGMGAVYRAVQMPVERQVAVKVLRADLQECDEGRGRFIREARAVSRLTHPNVVTLHDFGFDARDHPFMIMEYVDGESLLRWTQRQRLTLERIIHVLSQILSALADAHAADIVHRDIKPENFLLTRVGGDDDFVKLLDFGIARAAGLDRHARTATGLLVGSLGYMAPERWAGTEDGHLGDIFALGCVTFTLLTGRQLFEGMTAPAQAGLALSPDRFKAHVAAQLDTLPDGAEPAADVLRALLAHHPESRPDGAAVSSLAMRTAARIDGDGLHAWSACLDDGSGSGTAPTDDVDSAWFEGPTGFTRATAAPGIDGPDTLATQIPAQEPAQDRTQDHTGQVSATHRGGSTGATDRDAAGALRRDAVGRRSGTWVGLAVGVAAVVVVLGLGLLGVGAVAVGAWGSGLTGTAGGAPGTEAGEPGTETGEPGAEVAADARQAGEGPDGAERLTGDADADVGVAPSGAASAEGGSMLDGPAEGVPGGAATSGGDAAGGETSGATETPSPSADDPAADPRVPIEDPGAADRFDDTAGGVLLSGDAGSAPQAPPAGGVEAAPAPGPAPASSTSTDPASEGATGRVVVTGADGVRLVDSAGVTYGAGSVPVGTYTLSVSMSGSWKKIGRLDVAAGSTTRYSCSSRFRRCREVRP